MNYDTYIDQKTLTLPAHGFESELSPFLYDFQADITRWALRIGRAAIFADCGLGKTPMQLEWAHRVSLHADLQPVLIVCPLAVAEQTRGEAEKFGLASTLCQRASDVRPGINLTNYEKLHHFDPDAFGGIVLDESSILKAYDGKRKSQIIAFAETIPYRLACTATPAPNDYTELCNHAEYLGVMSEKEVKALFFTQDGNSTTSWRLKGHAVMDFWRWVASWAVALRRPSDLGYEDTRFALPPLQVKQRLVDHDFHRNGELFAGAAITLDEQRRALRESLPARVAACAEMVNNSPDPWIVWCNLNQESQALARAIPDSVEVTGSMNEEDKTEAMLAFSRGEIRVLVTKPTIAGFGMNWQHCAHTAFVGLSHSYEQFYQAVRRSWRFGQTRPVTAYIIDTTANRRVLQNIRRKEKQAKKLMQEIISNMNTAGQIQTGRQEAQYARHTHQTRHTTLHLGDCVDVVADLEDSSVGLSVFSPPFPGMYVYSNSKRDMGNTHDIDQMIEHMRFLVGPLLHKTMPGRHCCIHLTQGTAQKVRDGYIGLRDFRGAVIRLMEQEGWIYYGEVAIDKNPQVKAIRTKDRGLLFKTLANDSSHMHMALADYLLQFRRPGDNAVPIRAGSSDRYDNASGWISSEEWIRWARPVWYAADWVPDGFDGIAETDVLNAAQARETNDERHLAPLQLGVIERAIKLWSNPGDLVYDPFTGIGSTGYVAVRLNRRFVGSELKRSYFDHAVRHIERAESLLNQGTLFEMVPSDPRTVTNGTYGYVESKAS